MAQIVNLRRARKSKERQKKQQKGTENRAKYGRTKAERRTQDAEAGRQRRSIDGKRLEKETD